MIEKASDHKLKGPLDLSNELWRSYEWIADDAGHLRVHTVQTPMKLWYREGSTTHRVQDDMGIVHCVPAPGVMGCVLRWKGKKDSDPVQF